MARPSMTRALVFLVALLGSMVALPAQHAFAAVTINTLAVPVQAVTGEPITDTATLSGGDNPSGTITFDLFAPSDSTCSNSIFTSTVPVSGNGTYSSEAFLTSVQGNYEWIASYSGDDNNPAVSGECNEPGEGTAVRDGAPQIVTLATASASVGDPINDTASLFLGAEPTGTLEFTISLPGDTACTAPVLVGVVTVSGNGEYTSPSFIPTSPGSYRWRVSYSGDSNNFPAFTDCNEPNENTLVTQPGAQIVTEATPLATVGQPITDTATISGGNNPTGFLAFLLYGPNDPNCSTFPAFISQGTVVNGNGSYTSSPFTPFLPGMYRWKVSYTGDQNNLPITTPCNEPFETTLVNPAPAQIVTQATQTAAVGEPITDTAILSGGNSPTGTITFNLYGPADPTCVGAPVFTSQVTATGGGSYTSEPFVPAGPGSYLWIASYSGDQNNAPDTGACNDPNELTFVTVGGLRVVTEATPIAGVGLPIADTATLSGAFNPTGTITFLAYGPDDVSCALFPAYISLPVPVNGNGSYTSAPFTGTTAGAYNWVASYSGDPNNPSLTTPCGEPNETSFVKQSFAQVTTVATPTAPLGSSISDTATVVGLGTTVPTGTVTFAAFGPDSFCLGEPIFTSAGRPLTPGQSQATATATSEPFIPAAPGTYLWEAIYSGDASYLSIVSPCGAPGEMSVVTASETDVSIDKTCPANAIPGGTVTCTLAISTTGTATNVVVTDDLDEGLVFGRFAGQAGFNCTTQPGDPEIRCTRSILPAGDYTIRYTATVPDDAAPGSSFANRAEVAVDEDADRSNNVDTVTILLPGCTITGTGRGETLTGTAGPDIICGLGGADKILGRGGDDILIGGSGSDKIEGGAGNDTLDGGRGDDSLSGGAGPDQLFGGSGDDKLDGGAGRDRLLGQQGSDKLVGGGGNDTGDGGPGSDSCDSTENRTSCS